MNKKYFAIIIIIIIISIAFTSIIYFVNANKDDEDINSKAEEELKYIGREIINMMNRLNNISFTNAVLQEKKENTSSTNNSKSNSKNQESGSENSEDSSQGENSRDSSKENKMIETNVKYVADEKGILNSNLTEIEWDDLKNNSENLYSIWTRTLIDLHSLNINNEDILNFSSTLDMVTMSIKSEDKVQSLNNLARLYTFIPLYLEKILNDNKKINIENTKTCILNSCAYVEQDNWQEVKNQIQNSINFYTEIINSAEESEDYSKNKITKIYVLLNELNNTLSLEDKDIYYIKYKNLMEELVNL